MRPSPMAAAALYFLQQGGYSTRRLEEYYMSRREVNPLCCRRTKQRPPDFRVIGHQFALRFGVRLAPISLYLLDCFHFHWPPPIPTIPASSSKHLEDRRSLCPTPCTPYILGFLPKIKTSPSPPGIKARPSTSEVLPPLDPSY
jgi:hypothetical protein